MNRFFGSAAILAGLVSFLSLAMTAVLHAAEPALIPWPQKITMAKGSVPLLDQTRIVARDESLLPLAGILAEEIKLLTGKNLLAVHGKAAKGDVVLALDPKRKPEHYRLHVADGVSIVGGDYNAVAQGTATLLQLIERDGGVIAVSRVTIEDYPELEYRGAMFDIARKPYSIDTLKQIVQVCRLYKIRYVHLHMTDDNAFLFPSKAFPQLGKVNAGSSNGPAPVRYQLEELKQLVAYADARGVTLVPELELPGHCGGLVGGMPDVFAGRDADGEIMTIGMINVGNEKVYEVLDTLIGEICDVFRSSPYFHTGGDEVAMVNLEKSPQIMAFAKQHGLESPYYVQNPFQHRIHKLVTKYGKQMIVWDGANHPRPLPKDVIFMPWQHGTPVAAELVAKGYRVINAPWGTKDPYFDPYLCNGAQLRHGEPLMIGATAILWEAPETTAIPFLRTQGAIRNEPTHNPDSGRTHADFVRRVAKTDLLVDQLLYGFTFDGEGLVDPVVHMQLNGCFTERAVLRLRASVPAEQVHYTLDGSEPAAQSPAYTNPLVVTQSCTLKARTIDPQTGEAGPIYTRGLIHVPSLQHDAVGAHVTYKPDSPGYRGAGPSGLVDGHFSQGDDYNSAGWIGWLHADVEIDIDLKKPIPLYRVGGRFARGRFGLHLPKSVEFLVSEDGKSYRSIATIDQAKAGRTRGWFEVEVSGVTARYLRIKTQNAGDWTFVDEIAVNYQPLPPNFRHQAIGKTATLATPPSSDYSLPGIEGLTDGYIARSFDFANPYWLGTEGRNVEATIDLGSSIDIRNVGLHVLRFVSAGIYYPQSVEVLVSEDGAEFQSVGTIPVPAEDRPEAMATLETSLKNVTARYVRIVAKQQTWWTFVDEIFVNRTP